MDNYEKLRRAVITKLDLHRVRDRNELRSVLSDVSKYGADSGFGGFTYYSDTVRFASRYFALIMAELRESAADMGATVTEMVAGFQCLKGEDRLDIEAVLQGDRDNNSCTAVMNALAWYALEHVANREDT